MEVDILVNVLSERCQVPKRFAQFIYNVNLTNGNRFNFTQFDDLEHKINFVKMAMRTDTLTGDFANEIEMNAVSEQYDVPPKVAAISLLTERKYNSPLPRKTRIEFLKKVFKMLDQLIVFCLP